MIGLESDWSASAINSDDVIPRPRDRVFVNTTWASVDFCPTYLTVDLLFTLISPIFAYTICCKKFAVV